MSRDEVEAKVLSLATTYSGRKGASPDDYVCATLGIDREDAIEFYSEIERSFGVDLRPVTEVANRTRKRRFWRSTHQVIARDPRISEIVEIINSAGTR